MDNIRELINNEFSKFKSIPIQHIELIAQSGSNRTYYRIFTNKETYIATINYDIAENEAFFYLQSYFSKILLPVPSVLYINNDKNLYFQNDLGDKTVYVLLQQLKKENKEQEILYWYQRILTDLLVFQFSAIQGLDFTKCYPVSEFGEQAIRWDLNYFKYMFLKLTYAYFHEKRLEEEFNLLINYLLSADSSFFVYRDFQSRNIMIYQDKLYYIDFQGGRKGPLFYDLASLLYDAKAELSESIRKQLIEFYFTKLSESYFISQDSFYKYFYVFVFFRILQALGAYGYRGIYEQKQHFISSIKPAFDNLKYLFEKTSVSEEFPYLTQLLQNHFQHPFIQKLIQQPTSEKLIVHIKSFSYKNGYPEDNTIHGGGFVFDCRALPNPGKYDSLKYYTGKDVEVIQFMEQHEEVRQFMQHVYQLVSNSVSYYINRDFDYLSVAFGCTGGQHRSVYCAEKLVQYLTKKFKVKVILHHLNQQNWLTS